ncbi:hypothetical protein LTS15_002778 [Exophiala xenobiotica]|nr:hypothetical protein LTS15_002778 [Exophiala xenobiotica]
MSGFEAVFGAVSAGAGLLSLSVQLGESAMKLQRLYKAAKDAPSTIEGLLSELETMRLAMGQLEQHRCHESHSEALITRCIAQCQQHVQRVRLLVDDLESRLAKHKVRGRLYTAFKERDVNELLGGLERAKSSLHFAYMMYRDAEQQRRLSSLHDQFTSGNANISQQLRLLLLSSDQSPQHPHNASKSHPDEDNEMSLMAICGPNTLSMTTTQNHSGYCNGSEPTTRAKRKNGKSRLRACFAFPAWLSSRIWDFALLGAQSGWNIQFRTYNLVPEYAPVFRYARYGDLPALRRLFDSGEASPLDVTLPWDGFGGYRTLLEVSLASRGAGIV